MSPKSRPLPASRIVGLAALLLATSIGYPAPDVSADRPFGAALRCNGRAVTVNLAAGHRPTRGNDVISATRRADVIRARGGNDIICARGGNDVVIGGRGNDIILGGLGADRLSGGQGRDTVIGGVGNDLVGGGPGPDRLRGGHGRDIVVGGLGNDFLSGGAGFDRLSGGAGRDWLNGGAGRDRCAGGRHVDRGTLCSTMTGIETRAPAAAHVVPDRQPGIQQDPHPPLGPAAGPGGLQRQLPHLLRLLAHEPTTTRSSIPDQPGALHLHIFFGNKGADAASTYHSLRTTGNGTCSGGHRQPHRLLGADPARCGGPTGEAEVRPDLLQVRLSQRPAHRHQPHPQRVAHGGREGIRRPGINQWRSWSGRVAGTTRHDSGRAGPARSSSTALTFPQCWNGRDLDSPRPQQPHGLPDLRDRLPIVAPGGDPGDHHHRLLEPAGG